MANWLTGRVKNIKWWNDRLFSLILNAPIEGFKAGQFTKLAMNVDGKRITRAYSFVNPPKERDLEFYLIKVDGGNLSCPLSNLQKGDEIEISSVSSGYFTIDEVPKSEQLWLLSTGTAIGPFLSILQQGDVWRSFQKIILVHAVRAIEDLCYQELIFNLCNKYTQLKYVSIVSREVNPSGLEGRVPKLLESGALFQFCGIEPSINNSQFMICGNPQMVKDTSVTLNQMGYERNRRSTSGHITVEQYW
ncbi:ferredoxin--NADP(+) reductase [Pseudoalteromonas sp. NBT06-2]|uniref:ferredoxin--NADP reductase n=1 Tax=Pseudoalteromonas sp. NBT06-2 TaxID=2025950 RepID=UPI000BA6845C|nr:ferredoxin--NADP reductase [Pseudoalteromonas sp. NBT06-2]PAJ76145.1 ferredoxin--NADP(+) reductase [Pseudoalteromonas sp. NBT06-2]